MAALTTAQVQALSTTSLSDLEASQVAAMTTTQVRAITAAQITALSTTDVQSSRPTRSRLHHAQLNAFSSQVRGADGCRRSRR